MRTEWAIVIWRGMSLYHAGPMESSTGGMDIKEHFLALQWFCRSQESILTV